MSYMFQVLMQNRTLTPQEGQAALDQMNREVERRQGQLGAGAGVLKIDGVTRHEDPFPPWLRQVLVSQVGLQLDPINFCYFKAFSTEPEAVALMNWFENTFRQWCRASQPDLVDKLQSRVIDEHTALGEYHTY